MEINSSRLSAFPKVTSVQVMSPLKRTVILDLSEIYRPEAKNVDNFRDFDYNQIESNPLLKRVFNTYLEMHTKQTVEFVTNKVMQNNRYS